MSSSTISEGIILIAVIIAASTISITFFNSINQVDDISREQFSNIENKIGTSLRVIHVQKTGNNTIDFWVKNIGEYTFSENELEKFDILFGKSNDSISIYSLQNPSQTTYSFENNRTKYWLSGDTLKISVNSASELLRGDYYFSFNSPFGTNHRYSFSLGE
jgi:archaellum component FlaF (FlaF/FlaG flagellin family)